MRRRALAPFLIAAAVMLHRPAGVFALSEGPPGATTGDDGSAMTALGVDVEANQFLGAATSKIAIEVPPGRGTMTPHLALVYSSRAGDTPYGRGWELPIGKVSRSLRRGVPRYCDTTGGSCPDPDEFAVSLPEMTVELVNVGGNGSRCGAAPTSGYKFAARIDESHVCVIADRGTNSWLLHDTSGRNYYFGQTATARTGRAGAAGGFDDTFEWHLTRVVDRDGNILDFTYASNDGVIYPERVDYGGHVQGLGHSLQVDLVWGTRAAGQERVAYSAGFRQVVRLLLTDVYVRALNGRTRSATGDVRRYRFTHAPSATNGRPLLTGVTLYGTDPATPLRTASGADATKRFSYAETSKLVYEERPGLEILSTDRVRGEMDTDTSDPVDGDLEDSDCVKRDFLDLTGDGRPDFVDATRWCQPGCTHCAANCLPDPTWAVFENRGTEGATIFASTPTAWRAPDGCISNTPPATEQPEDALLVERTVVDVDGDGRPDYVDARGSTWKVYRNEGSGFSTTWTAWTNGGPYIRRQINRDEIGGPDPQGTTRTLLDLNADGLPDVVIARGTAPTWNCGAGSWEVRWNTGSGFTGSLDCLPAPDPKWLGTNAWFSENRTIKSDLFDINGDGLPDFVKAQSGSWSVWYGTGRAFLGPYAWSGAPQALIRSTNDPQGGDELRETIYDTFDVNGDGLPDFVDGTTWGADDRWVVHLNTGNGFAPGAPWANTPTAVHSPYWIRRQREGKLAWDPQPQQPAPPALPGGFQADTFDVDGNGYPDLIRWVSLESPWTYGWRVYLAHPVDAPSSQHPADVLTTVENEVGGITRLGYTTTVDLDHTLIDPDLGKPAGQAFMPFGLWVLARIEHEDTSPAPALPDDRVVRTEFAYRGGYFDPDRREFRGFRHVARRGEHGVTQQTTHHQTEILQGRPLDVLTHTGPLGSEGDPDLEWLALSRDQQLWECSTGTGTTAACPEPAVPGARYHPVVVRRERTDYSSYFDVPWIRNPSGTRSIVRTFSIDRCGNTLSETADEPPVGSGPTVQTVTTYWSPSSCTSQRVCEGICNLPETVTIVGGEKKRFTYYAGGQLYESWIEDPANAANRLLQARMEYDAWNNLAAVVDGRTPADGLGGVRTTFAYEPEYRIHPVAITHDAGAGRLNHVETFDYDVGFGEATRKTDASGNPTYFAHDAFGRLWKVAEPPQSLSNPTREFTYVLDDVKHLQRVDTLLLNPGHPRLRISSFSDSIGRSLQVQSDAEVGGVPVTVVTGAVRYGTGGSVVKEYAPLVVGEAPAAYAPVQMARPGTDVVHDEFGRVVRRIAPQAGSGPGVQTSTSYRTARIVRTCDPRHNAASSDGQCTEEENDAFGRAIERRTYLGSATTPYSLERTEYDAGGRAARVIQNPDGANASPAITEMFYDPFGRRIRVLDPDSGFSSGGVWVKGTWRYGWDAAGSLVYEDDPVTGQHLHIEYDNLKRVRKRYRRAGDVQNAGTLTLLAEYTYDDPAVPNGTGRLTRVVSYGRDQTVNPTGTVDTSIEAYDARGNIETSRKAITFAGTTRSYRTTSQHDAIGRMTSTTHPWSATAHETLLYGYAPRGKLRTITSNRGVTYLTNVRHDVLGRPVQVDYGNKVRDLFTYGGPTDQYRLRELETVCPTATGCTVGGDLVYRHLFYEDYDPAGNVRRIRDARHEGRAYSQSQLAHYDRASRLVHSRQCGAPTPAPYASDFSYDAWGNLTGKDGATYAYPGLGSATAGPHQATALAGGSAPGAIGYDRNGNMTALPGSRALLYDAAGQLVEVRHTGSGATLGKFLYDYNGARAASETAEDGVTFYFGSFDVRGNDIIRHVGTGDRVIASSKRSGGSTLLARGSTDSPVMRASLAPGALVLGLLILGVCVPGRTRRTLVGRLPRRLVTASAAALLIAQMPLPPSADAQCGLTVPITFYHPDHLGTPSTLTNQSGVEIEHAIYRPYGALGGAYENGSSKPGTAASYGFTGHRAEEGTGLLYFGARYYDPALGMFVTQDPADQLFNPYTYAAGNPMSLVDPTGAFAWIPFLILVAVSFTIGFTLAAAQAIENGASPGDAALAGLIGGAVSAASAVIAGPVAGKLGPAVAAVIRVGMAGYGLAEGIRSGNGAGALLSTASLAVAIAGAANAVGKSGLAAEISSSLSPPSPTEPPDPSLSGEIQPRPCEGGCDYPSDSFATRHGNTKDAVGLFDKLLGWVNFFSKGQGPFTGYSINREVAAAKALAAPYVPEGEVGTAQVEIVGRRFAALTYPAEHAAGAYLTAQPKGFLTYRVGITGTGTAAPLQLHLGEYINVVPDHLTPGSLMVWRVYGPGGDA